MRARELGRKGLAVGVREVVGDLSGTLTRLLG